MGYIELIISWCDDDGDDDDKNNNKKNNNNSNNSNPETRPIHCYLLSPWLLTILEIQRRCFYGLWNYDIELSRFWTFARTS